MSVSQYNRAKSRSWYAIYSPTIRTIILANLLGTGAVLGVLIWRGTPLTAGAVAGVFAPALLVLSVGVAPITGGGTGGSDRRRLVLAKVHVSTFSKSCIAFSPGGCSSILQRYQSIVR